jgi:hypothetical protein
MPNVKTGDALKCEVCGLTVVVDEECGCAVAEIICCEEPMVNKGPATSKKKDLPSATAKKKAAVKKVKNGAEKKTVKPAAKKSIASKKAVKKAAKK